MALPYHNSPERFELWKRRFNAQFKGFNQYEVIDGPYKYLDYVQRTLAVCSPPTGNIIWAALKNGLYKISNLGARPYYVNNLPVFASSLAVYKNRVIVGTINNGVLIINGNSVKHLSTVDGLLSNNIAGIKITGNELLIYNNGLVQIVDLATFKIADNYRMPGVNDEAIIDAELVNGQLFTADRNSVYKVPVEKKRYDAQISTVGFIVNGRDTDVTKQMTLRYYQNEIGINLGIPSLLNGHDIIIKYRLSTKGAAKWLYSNAGERNFRFYALSAGSYQFEAAAGYLQAGIYGHPIKINFTIMPPWWRTGWAICAMVIAGFLIITAILRLYYRNLLAARKTEFEKKLAIEKERQRISSDMHDDIGASLSAIKLFAGNVKQSPGSDIAIPEIYEMVSDLSDKTREVIWSLSQVYDTLESLIYYIGSTADKLFEHSGIKFRTILPENIPDCKIDNDKRRDVYLIMKEALNNIIKHANATEALLEFIILNNCLSIKIQDNGIGFPVYPKEKINGQGMINIKNRIKNLGGEIVIERANGTIINLTIPL
jgi:signal transduction histidine kinase